MNRDSNSYTIIYASVMVVLVAIALALTAISLKSRKDNNKRIDKMEQILRAINVDKGKIGDKNVLDVYKSYIVKEILIDLDGNVKNEANGDNISKSEAFDIDTELVFKKIKQGDTSKAQLPVFVALVDSKYYYVLPMNGAGLWDKIWGYIAVDAENHSTVFGIDFGNKGETPGLGGNMSTPEFSQKFLNKDLYKNGEFRSIRVVKKGVEIEGTDKVDALSGGTLTSNGIDEMIKNSVSSFTKFLENYKLEK